MTQLPRQLADQAFSRASGAPLRHHNSLLLDARNRVRAPNAPSVSRGHGHSRHGGAQTSGGGSSGKAMAGAVRIGHTVSAAITSRRLLEPVEAHIALISGGLLLVLAALAVIFPRAFSYPLAIGLAWLAIALLYRGVTLHAKHD
jgi:cardiolipin synthase A/B